MVLSCFAGAEGSKGLCGLFVYSSLVFLQVGFFKRNLKERMEATVDASNETTGEDAGQPASGEEAKDPGCLEPLHEKEAQDGGGRD